MLGIVSEHWAATYLHVLVELIIFAFGLPTVIQEMLAPEDVRRVVRKRGSRWPAAMVACLGFTCVLFVWVLHPVEEPLGPWEAFAADGLFTLVVIAVAIYWVLEAGRVSMTIGQQALRDGILLCEGTIRIGWVDTATLRPARIPVHILEALQ